MKTADDRIWMKETTEGTGKCSIAILFARSKVEEHKEYPKIAMPTVTGVDVSSSRCMVTICVEKSRYYKLQI